MNLVANLGQILSTVRFVTASALEKLDSTSFIFLGIDLNKSNVLEIVGDLLHIGFWQSNNSTVEKLYKIFNKVFS